MDTSVSEERVVASIFRVDMTRIGVWPGYVGMMPWKIITWTVGGGTGSGYLEEEDLSNGF
jgi:hypothetical protein